MVYLSLCGQTKRKTCFLRLVPGFQRILMSPDLYSRLWLSCQWANDFHAKTNIKWNILSSNSNLFHTERKTAAFWQSKRPLSPCSQFNSQRPIQANRQGQKSLVGTFTDWCDYSAGKHPSLSSTQAQKTLCQFWSGRLEEIGIKRNMTEAGER